MSKEDKIILKVIEICDHLASTVAGLDLAERLDRIMHELHELLEEEK